MDDAGLLTGGGIKIKSMNGYGKNYVIRGTFETIYRSALFFRVARS